MYLKIFSYIVIVSLVSFLQISFVSGLPLYLSGLNLVLIYLLFSLLVYNFEKTVYLAAGLGLIMDLYSFSFVGSYVICLVVGVMLVNFLLKNFLTDRSLYSLLALYSIFYIYFKLYFIIIDSILTTFHKATSDFIFDKNFFTYEAGLLLVNLILIVVIYYLFNLTSRSLKPTFLKR